MYIFTMSLVCIIALFTGDVRFQANGYALWLYYAPSAVGALGLAFGFIGLLGIYDDKPTWVQAFLGFFVFKIVVMVFTAVFDYRNLHKCDSWLTVPEHLTDPNPQLEVLAMNNICPWARWSFLIGTTLDVGFNCYLLFCVFCYYKQIALNPPYSIDFGDEKYDVAGRWRAYQVKDPRYDYAMEEAEEPKKAPVVIKQADAPPPPPPSYGATGNNFTTHGPDGMPSATIFAPAGAQRHQLPFAH